MHESSQHTVEEGASQGNLKDDSGVSFSYPVVWSINSD